MTDDARRVLAGARASRVFPAATAELGTSDGVLWQDTVGSLTFDDPAPVDLHTPFDLASLTKVIATASVIATLVDAGGVRVGDQVGRYFGEWRGEDRGGVTVRDLLEHASGLPARLVDAPPGAPSPPGVRREFEHDICAIPLEYPPRTQSIYSDLGFILLGFLAADLAGEALDARFARIWPDPSLAFGLSRTIRQGAAPTRPMADDRRRGRMLVGEVHDNYAAALGGAAGHAGLFGTAPAVGRFARAILAAVRGDPHGLLSPERIRQFTRRSSVPSSSRALGWDTMLPSSSCGTRMSPAAFGHVGFTGTSLWIDPTRDRYFVLLTNRAAGGGTLDDMRVVRRAFHDALGDV
jgi:CubicO group peptidase (beta-lactamase class C family)